MSNKPTTDSVDTAPKKRAIYCSFCGSEFHEVRLMVSGHGVNICEQCIDVCNAIIAEHDSTSGDLEYQSWFADQQPNINTSKD